MKKVKISHLFHWLYALLMLLPAFAIGVTCAYAIFNKNAYQSYYGETINEENIETPTNINKDTTYYLDWSNLTSYTNSPSPRIYLQNFNVVNKGNISDNTYNYIVSVKDNIEYIILTQYNSLPNIQFGGVDVNTINLTSTNWEFSFNINSYTGQLNLSDFCYIEYNSFSFVSEVFYYSIDKVQESPLFSWSFNSFLAQPFEYITDVFSIPHGNIVVFFASYWLAISIIWLCFDLVMYVPNLVHKWLDKGSIS